MDLSTRTSLKNSSKLSLCDSALSAIRNPSLFIFGQIAFKYEAYSYFVASINIKSNFVRRILRISGACPFIWLILCESPAFLKFSMARANRSLCDSIVYNFPHAEAKKIPEYPFDVPISKTFCALSDEVKAYKNSAVSREMFQNSFEVFSSLVNKGGKDFFICAIISYSGTFLKFSR